MQTQESHFSTQRLDHLGIVAGVCREIGLIDQVDKAVGPSRRKVSVGEAVQAMVLNALGFVGRALYLSPEFFHNKPVDLLVREGLTAQDFNDDSLGRALDRLYEAGVTEVFAQVASHALGVYDIDHQFVHLDSTSFSLHGEYAQDDADPSCIEVTQGYSKDRRPDLKQVVVSLITSQRSAIPLWLEALSGNSSDKQSFVPTLKAYTAQLQESDRPYFVADSALYSADNLKALSQIRWVSRVPETIQEARGLLETIKLEQMAPLGQAGYAGYEHQSTYGGVEQRWLIIYSKQAHQREMATFEKRLARYGERATKELRALSRQRFACREDAQQAVAQAERGWRYHRAEVEVEAVKRYRRRGRPKEGEQPEIIAYRVVGSVVKDPQAIAETGKSKGKFIVATNETDAEALPAGKILSAYKEQGVSVERGFRFLKDPLFFADSLFLKRPQRLMALLMVMGLALLVYALAERKVRQALEQRGESIPNQVGKPTQRPTMRRIFQIFEGIDLLLIAEGSEIQERRLLNMGPIHHQILELLGTEVQKCYLLEN